MADLPPEIQAAVRLLAAQHRGLMVPNSLPHTPDLVRDLERLRVEGLCDAEPYESRDGPARRYRLTHKGWLLYGRLTNTIIVIEGEGGDGG